MSNELNAQQKIFCLEYLKHYNITEAALKAGYSKKTASSQGSQLLKNPKVESYLKSQLSKAEMKTGITLERVMLEFALIAFSDMKDYLNIDDDSGLVQAKGLQSLPKNASRVVKKVKERRTIKQSPGEGDDIILHSDFEYELHDKIRALENLKDMLSKSGGIDENTPLKEILNKIKEKGAVKI